MNYNQYQANQFSSDVFSSKLRTVRTKLSAATKPLDVKDVVTYIVTTQKQPYQFQLLRGIEDSLLSISLPNLRIAFSDFENVISQILKFDTYLLLIKYIIKYDSRISSLKLIQSLNDHYRRSEFFNKDIERIEKMVEKGEKINKRFTQIIKLGVEYLPQLYKKIDRAVDLSYLSNLLDWILIFEINNKSDLGILKAYCSFLAKACLQGSFSSRDLLPNFKKAITLLHLVVEKSLKNFEGAENLCFILEQITNSSVFTIITSQSHDLNEYPSETYLKCFHTLTRAIVGQQTLKFILALSVSLKTQYKFNILKSIYLDFIIPKIVRYCKFCKPQQKEVQRLVAYYVNGFLNKIDIELTHLCYFIENAQMMSKKQLFFWLQMLVCLVYEKPDQQKSIKPFLNQITTCKDIKQIVSQLTYDTKKQDMWSFLDKDLQERKKYKYYRSQYVGIKNQNINCYMITCMQSLFMSGCLPKIIRSYQQHYISKSFMSNQIKLPLLFSLNLLFNKLQRRSQNIMIDNLKSQGPQSFRQDLAQQDCQHYLNELFEDIEKQICEIPDKRAKEEFQQRFKKMFEIVIRTEITCSECKSRIKNGDEKSYILSIDYTETLSQQWENNLEEYTCDKCKFKGTHKMKSKIVKFPQILFVHIKRFHFDPKFGEMKMLEEANIIRKFQNYALEGFICHIGSKVLCGHYTLYYKNPNDSLKWILFNDKQVCELKLDSEDECFQKNLKSQNTPYIAIYKKSDKR